jgi:hypothetical protein
MVPAMTCRAFVVVLLALPVAAAAQVGGQDAPSPTAPPSPAAPALAAPQEPPPLPPPPPAPQGQAEPGSPRHSPWRLSASIGAGTSYGKTYFLLGARLGRELVGGLALELDGQYWAGQSPSLGKLAPGLTWYSPVRVYVGAYYARWFVGSGFPDQDAIGGRAGYILLSRGRTFAAVGIAYERVLDCSSNCESYWPEASVGVSF